MTSCTHNLNQEYQGCSDRCTSSNNKTSNIITTSYRVQTFTTRLPWSHRLCTETGPLEQAVSLIDKTQSYICHAFNSVRL